MKARERERKMGKNDVFLFVTEVRLLNRKMFGLIALPGRDTETACESTRSRMKYSTFSIESHEKKREVQFQRKE